MFFRKPFLSFLFKPPLHVRYQNKRADKHAEEFVCQCSILEKKLNYVNKNILKWTFIIVSIQNSLIGLQKQFLAVSHKFQASLLLQRTGVFRTYRIQPKTSTELPALLKYFKMRFLIMEKNCIQRHLAMSSSMLMKLISERCFQSKTWLQIRGILSCVHQTQFSLIDTPDNQH